MSYFVFIPVFIAVIWSYEADRKYRRTENTTLQSRVEELTERYLTQRDSIDRLKAEIGDKNAEIVQLGKEVERRTGKQGKNGRFVRKDAR